jgi:hypothetical protein
MRRATVEPEVLCDAAPIVRDYIADVGRHYADIETDGPARRLLLARSALSLKRLYLNESGQPYNPNTI